MSDENEPAGSNEGADPSSDIARQNPGETTTTDLVDQADPHKFEKLTKADNPNGDRDAGSD